MAIQTQNVTMHQIIELIRNLSFIDQCSLLESLNRQVDACLPERATIDEAIALYLADRCSLGRAAELARVNRWELIEILKKRKTPVMIDTEFSASEMDAIADDLERKGVLC